MEKQLQNLSLAENAEKAPKLGYQPLAAKKPRNTKGVKVQVETNIRKLTIAKNQPIFKYAVIVLFVFKKADGSEAKLEMSKSTKKGAEHENDKNRCQKMYQLAVKKTPALQSGGPYFYDRQGSLYTLSQLKTEEISCVVTEGVSRRPNFVRAEFLLQKVDQSFQLWRERWCSLRLSTMGPLGGTDACSSSSPISSLFSPPLVPSLCVAAPNIPPLSDVRRPRRMGVSSEELVPHVSPQVSFQPVKKLRRPDLVLAVPFFLLLSSPVSLAIVVPLLVLLLLSFLSLLPFFLSSSIFLSMSIPVSLLFLSSFPFFPLLFFDSCSAFV
ncbi:hypothetical protein CAEBREN_07641 [Caenorhabditis brenneri]|uniref:Uncharacterized protein n=1 Tax=Caenorhabditis brenneri TaxID=135651 RepID=G0NEG1_CAEBE|nr:hypothetical protein CAEBREN_07641 [Caenorhabditis brenneri]